MAPDSFSPCCKLCWFLTGRREKWVVPPQRSHSACGSYSSLQCLLMIEILNQDLGWVIGDSLLKSCPRNSWLKRRTSITWALARNAESRVPDLQNGKLHLNKILRWSVGAISLRSPASDGGELPALSLILIFLIIICLPLLLSESFSFHPLSKW